MPTFSPELIQIMRAALEDVMTKIPSEHATPGAKAYLAECILRAAAKGQTTYNELITVATDEIQTIFNADLSADLRARHTQSSALAGSKAL